MALVLLDRVQQTGTANTTVSFTLSGSVVGYQSFSAIGNGNTTFYAATDVSGSWEVGVGTYSTTGPTLTRTTILSSSNSGSAVTFSGTVNVFVTYPSEQSVNLDASGNVSALGTITSGVWNGTTVPVAYGGTGVTASSGANSVVLRDANQNIYANSVTQELDVVTSAGGTTVLTLASSHFQILIGTTTQTFQLPDATTLPTGSSWIFDNDSTGNLFVVNAASGAVDTVAPGGYATVFLELNGTTAGTWGRFGMIPSEVNWGTNSLDMGGSTVITNGVWQGTPVASGYGGTGLTTFSAANNALYSTGSTTLTAGTLPVAAGGTGATTLTGYVYGNGTSAMTASTTIPTSSLSGSINLATQVTGTLPLTNGGTGQTTAAAAFNALNPMTTTGDIIYEASPTTAARLGIGTTGQVLTVAGGIPSWATPSTGGGTITRTDFTATAGQTVFTVSYTVGLIDVYQNGAKLAQADFTATNGTSFTLATGAAAGDLIQAEVFSSLNIYSTITYEVFNGTGSQTVFTMSSVPANSASLLVAISGVVQDPGTYSVSSTTLTFTTAPPSGTGNVSVRYLGIASVGTVGSFSAGTTGLTPASATTGAVVLGGTLNVANGGTGLNTLASGRIPYGNGTGALASSSTFVFDGTNLGIGTASPSSMLHVTGTMRTDTGLSFTSIGSINGSANKLDINSAGVGVVTINTSSTERMRISSTGLVGIGRSPTTNLLEVAGIISSNATGTLQVQASGNDGYFNMTGTGTTYFRNGAGFTERMVIDSSGNVGIGTSSPGAMLDVLNGIAARGGSTNSTYTSPGNLALKATGDNPYISFHGNTGTRLGYLQIQAAACNLMVEANQPLAFGTNNVERMRITSAGGVSFGSSGTAYGTTGQVLISNGDTAPTWGSAIVSGTRVATTSGTAFDFTSIPSWVKRITVMMYEVSTNGGGNLLVQLGTSGGIVSTGYLSTNAWFNNTTLGNGTDTTGMFASVTPSASGLMSGIFTLTTLGSNIWVSTSTTKQSTNQSSICASSITLGGTLTQLRFTSVGGTNTFDNGSVNILYE